MIIPKVLLLFIAIWMTLFNAYSVILHEPLKVKNITYQSFGLTGFVVFQWLI